MKNKTALLFFSLTLLALAFDKKTNADISFSNDNKFKQVKFGDFINAVQAPNGTVWIGPLTEAYTNCLAKRDAAGEPILDADGLFICEKHSGANALGSITGRVIDSDAVNACKGLGARLPNSEDYLKLMRQFTTCDDASDYNYCHWTKDQLTNLYNVFPKMENNDFWDATYGTPEMSELFCGGNRTGIAPYVSEGGFRVSSRLVYCVVH